MNYNKHDLRCNYKYIHINSSINDYVLDAFLCPVKIFYIPNVNS